jgi:hypothetical protein
MGSDARAASTGANVDASEGRSISLHNSGPELQIKTCVLAAASQRPAELLASGRLCVSGTAEKPDPGASGEFYATAQHLPLQEGA